MELAASDRASLLVEWMEELLYRADIEDLVPDGIEALELRRSGLRARVRATRGRPSPLVKAVTYHGLRFEHVDGVWCATVILDV